MRINTWVNVIGCVLLFAGCSGSVDSPSVPGGAGVGTASSDSFTDTVAQNAASGNEDQEPSDQLAEMAITAPDDTEPANL